MIKTINAAISYIPAHDSPLSADVAVIKGQKTWLFDVGSSDDAFEEIQRIKGEKCAVISHFHPDHMANLERLADLPVYVGANTLRYSGRGTVIDAETELEKGIGVFPIPSSHAKGSLGLIVNDEFVFIGDALAPTVKKGRIVYNAQLLNECIRLFKSITAPYFIQSHEMDRVYEKAEIISKLESIYARRNAQEAYIEQLQSL